MSIYDNTPVKKILQYLPTGNNSLDRQLIAIFNKYSDSNNMMSIILELSILSALYPKEMAKINSHIM